MPDFLVVAIVLIIVIGLYLGSYLLNSNTKTPEGVIAPPECESCNLHSNPNPQKDCEKK